MKENMWHIWVLVGYVVGSIPFGLLIGFARGVDIRKAGSGNVGATNVVRLLGKKLGAVCLLLDVCKGLGPVLGAGVAMGYLGRVDLSAAEAGQWLAVGAAAVCGHVFSFWLKFKGGKGVATGLGVLLGFWPMLTVAGLCAVVTWVVMLKVFRFVSLASIVAAVGIPVYLFVYIAVRRSEGVELGVVWPFYVVAVVLAGLVVVRHRGNIGRIMKGTEPRVGEKKS